MTDEQDQPVFLFQTHDRAIAEAIVDEGTYLTNGVLYDRLSLTKGEGDPLRPDVEQWVVRGYPTAAA